MGEKQPHLPNTVHDNTPPTCRGLSPPMMRRARRRCTQALPSTYHRPPLWCLAPLSAAAAGSCPAGTTEEKPTVRIVQREKTKFLPRAKGNIPQPKGNNPGFSPRRIVLRTVVNRYANHRFFLEKTFHVFVYLYICIMCLTNKHTHGSSI
jgi:hypothetical protein